MWRKVYEWSEWEKLKTYEKVVCTLAFATSLVLFALAISPH